MAFGGLGLFGCSGWICKKNDSQNEACGFIGQLAAFQQYIQIYVSAYFMSDESLLFCRRFVLVETVTYMVFII